MDLLGYTELFVGVLALYLAFAAWARLDSRYPIFASLAFLLAGTGLTAAGDTGAGEVLGVYAFLLLSGGLIAMVFTIGRDRPAPGGPAGEAVDQRQPEADPSLHDLQEQPVALVDGAGPPDGEQVHDGHGEPHRGEEVEGGMDRDRQEEQTEGEHGDAQRDEVVGPERVDPLHGGQLDGREDR